MKNTTIKNCFHKSTVQQVVFTQQTFNKLNFNANSSYYEAITNLQANIDSLQKACIVEQAMDIYKFMNPIKECAKVDVRDLDQDVLNKFTHSPDFESDEEVEEQPIVKAGQALEAAKLLKLWYLQQDVVDDGSIKATRKQISQLEIAKQVKRQQGRQGKLDSWLVK
jgi:hypothetical protein